MASDIKYCAKCERCHENGLNDGEDCYYYGEPCGCNHPNRGFAESANDTVADIIAINRAIYQGCEECSLSDKDVKWFLDLIDRFEAAHEREKCEWAASITKQRAINKELVDEVSDLRRRLKIAEDALDASLSYNNSEELRKAQRKAKRALAAIREEGGAK